MSKLNLLSQIDRRYIGIIWLTQNPMSLYTQTGQIMNYLSNGLLGKSYKHHTSLQSNEFVCATEQFGTPFFICHKEVKGALSTKIQNFDLIKSFISDARKSRDNIGDFALGIVCEGANINSEPLFSQCSESLDKISIQILN